MARTCVAGVLVLLLLLQMTPIEELQPISQAEQSSRNSGVDLSATEVSISYSNPIGNIGRLIELVVSFAPPH